MKTLHNVIKSIVKMANSPEKEVEKLIQSILKDTPLANKVFSVGGYVRDELLGIDSKDLDLVVEKQGGAEELAKLLYSKYPLGVTSPHKLGEAYPIWHVSFKEDIGGFKTKGAEIDIADTMKESFPDSKTRQRVTEPGTLKEDVERRDFTVNMLMRDLTTNELLDLTGVSKSDIEGGVLRGHPNVDLNKIFSDDPLRMIRLIRFNCKYDWHIPLVVLKTVKKNAERIKIISGERIRDELVKIMKLGKLHRAIKLMKATGLLEYVLPEVKKTVKVEQNPEFHSEGDVFRHTLKVLEKAKPTVEAQLSALFHDLGKVDTQQYIGSKIKFLGHEEVSSDIAEAIMRRLSFDLATIEKVKKIVKNHMRGHFSEEMGPKAVRKYVRELEDVLDDVLHITEIDALSSLGLDKKPAHPNTVPLLKDKIKEILKIPMSKKPLLSGLDIMDILKLRSGPEVGKAMKAIQDLEDDYAGKGKVLSKEEAKEFLKKEYQ